jgi:hypothetical protein
VLPGPCSALLDPPQSCPWSLRAPSWRVVEFAHENAPGPVTRRKGNGWGPTTDRRFLGLLGRELQSGKTVGPITSCRELQDLNRVIAVAWMMLRDPKGVADQFPHQLTDAFVIPVTYASCRAREFRLLSIHIDFRWVMLRR